MINSTDMTRRQALKNIGLAAAGTAAALTTGETLAAAPRAPEDIFLIGDSFRIGGYLQDSGGNLVLDGMGNPTYLPETGWQYHLEMMAPEFNFRSLINQYGDPESSNGTPYVLNHIDDIVAAYPPAPGKKILMNIGLWDASIFVLDTPLDVYVSRITDITNQFKNVHGYDVRWLETTGIDSRRFPITAYRAALQNYGLHDMGDALGVPVYTTMYTQRIENWKWNSLGAHFTVEGYAEMAAAIYRWIKDW
jgi:hypothetical protein